MARPRKFTHLASTLRNEIAAYKPGWPLASIRHIASEYDVSPNTVRKSLAQLCDEGLIQPVGPAGRYARQASGSPQPFIRPYPRVALLLDDHWLSPVSHYYRQLVCGLATGLMNLHVPCILFARDTPVRPIPGGFEVGSPPLACSAIGLASGGADKTLESLLETGGVVLALDYLARIPGVDCLAVDCEQEAQLLVEYLVGRNHRYIGALAASAPYTPGHWDDRIDPDARRLMAAILAAKQRRRLPSGPNYHAIAASRIGDNETGVAAALTQVFRSIPAPTAIICFNPELAALAETILRERHGLRCPEGICLVCRKAAGEPSRYPAAAVDAAHMGQVAATHLLSRLCNLGASACAMTFPSKMVEADGG